MSLYQYTHAKTKYPQHHDYLIPVLIYYILTRLQRRVSQFIVFERIVTILYGCDYYYYNKYVYEYHQPYTYYYYTRTNVIIYNVTKLYRTFREILFDIA